MLFNVKAEAGKKVIMIFFLIVALTIACYIGFKSADTYNDSKNYSVSNLKSTVDCVGYVYEISNVKYEGGSLSFVIENQPHSSHSLETLIINATKIHRVELGNFVPSAIREIIVVNIPAVETFMVYHEGCPGFAQQCRLSTAECERV